MEAQAWSALLSAAAYLCCAADDLRVAGLGAFAEQIGELIDILDVELTLSDRQ